MNIDKFRSDLLVIQFVSSPSDDLDLLHEQYMSGLSGLANRFGSFFIDKIKKIRDTFKHTRSKSLHPDKELPTFSSFQVVTESEVLKFIKEAPSKTCSLDPCPTHIVKQCIDILLPSLTNLVNLSLINGIFPNPFKQAIVTALLKKSTFQKRT